MSDKHPELIFVAGPQAGQRIALSNPVAMLGRGGDADILFSEEYISRSQARYELVQAGPTLENLSRRGTWINGKRYKTGKRVLLETGDLIGAGQETQVLFVSAGDDPDSALATYQESANTGKDAFGQKVKPPKQPPPPDLIESEPAAEQDDQPDEAESSQKRPSDLPAGQAGMSVAERLESEQKARRKKIFIGLGIYLAVIVAIAIALKMRPGSQEPPWPVPPKLTKNEIADFIRAPIEDIPLNKLHAEKELEKAEGLYQQYGVSDTYRLYECLSAFKMALACSGKGYFDDPEHGLEQEQMYKAILDELTQTVQKKYKNAYFQEYDKKWDQAEKEFDDILRIYRPDKPDGLYKNILSHNKRVKHFQQKSKPKKRRMFGR